MGLTRTDVNITDAAIAADDARAYIDRERVRALRQAIETLSEKDIYHIAGTAS